MFKAQQKLCPKKRSIPEKEEELEENNGGFEEEFGGLEEERAVVATVSTNLGRRPADSIESWNEDAVNFEKQSVLGVSEVFRIPHSEERHAAAMDLEATSLWHSRDLQRRYEALPSKEGAIMTPARLQEVHIQLTRSLDSSNCYIDRSLGGIVGAHSRPSSSSACAFCVCAYGAVQRYAGPCFDCGKEGCIGCIVCVSLEVMDRPGNKQRSRDEFFLTNHSKKKEPLWFVASAWTKFLRPLLQ